jgi:hypothetical protein
MAPPDERDVPGGSASGQGRPSEGAGKAAGDGRIGDNPAAKPTVGSSAGSVRPLRRPANLRQAPGFAKISMAVFTVGLVAILVAVVMVASGARHLPLWLNLVILLAPIGLIAGLIDVLVNARRSRS